MPVRTEGAAVPSAPRSVKACAAAPGSMTVSWRRPLSAGAAKVDQYQVVRWASGVPKKAFKFSAGKRSATIDGLEPGNGYSFKVVAHNAVGWGAASKTVTAVPGGFGFISGVCGVVAPQLDEPTPTLFVQRFDFRNDPYDLEVLPLLTSGAQDIHAYGNAGGSSIIGEMFAYETLARFEGATLLKTETEILYDVPGKRTDLLVEIAGTKAGVSVMRAVSFPPESPYPVAVAAELLGGKLVDIVQSSQNVAAEDAWAKQILVVMAYSDVHAASIEDAWLEVDAATKADTIVYVIVTDGSDSPVYFNS